MDLYSKTCVSKKERLRVPKHEDILRYSLLSPEEQLNQRNNVSKNGHDNGDSSAVISVETK